MERGESSRRPKRPRVPNAPSSPSPAQEPLELIGFHQTRLANLRRYSWYPMLWLDTDFLRPFGWDQSVRDYLTSVGWDFFLRPPHPHIYREATLEFLASVTLERTHSSVPGVPVTIGVSFWMHGAYRYMTLEDFNVTMGFHLQDEVITTEYRAALCDRPEDWAAESMWGVVTGDPLLPSTMRGSRLDVPLRICHKLLSGTLHARRESQGKITISDLFVLYCMHQGIRCNPGYAFLRSVRDFGSRPTGSIMVASLISPLAEHWGCLGREDTPTGLQPEFITGAILSHMRILSRSRSGTGFVLYRDPSEDMIFESLDESFGQEQQTEGPEQPSSEHPQSEQPHPRPQPQAQPPPQQQRFLDPDSFYQRMDEERSFNQGHYQQLNMRMDNLTRRMEEMIVSQQDFQRRMLRRFPSPASSSSSSSEDHQPEQT